MSAEPSENKVLASQKFQFYRLSVQLTQSPVHTNDPFGFFLQPFAIAVALTIE